jgi:ABC-2 type transport system ATP-binding protein
MQPAIERVPAARAPAARSPDRVVHLDGVTKTFGKHVAVDDLTLTIPRGSVYGFIGPNGAGKTSTIRMIMHIHLADRGTVEVLGAPAGRTTARRIGYLPEERGLYPKMRVRDVILYFGRLKGRTRAELAPRIDEWLEKFGLSPWRLKKCQELSKGMQQKVQFIATVIHEPELVILDEPFSGLDPVNTEVLIGVIEQLKRAGKTVIFSTHVMEHAEKLCDAVFMICKGKKVLDGTLEEIRARFRDDVIEVEGDGERAAFEGAPGVTAVREHPGRYELTVARGADVQRILQHALARFRVRRFEVRAPRLHDIFLKLAGEDAVDAATVAAVTAPITAKGE